MLSDNVTVKTKYYKSNEINHIELEKNSEYVVTNTEETGNFCGTEITLDYDKFFEVFPNEAVLADFVRKYFFSNIPITVKDLDARKEIAKSTSSSVELLTIIDREAINAKYEDVECSQYSNIIDGTIRIREEQRKTSFEVQPIGEKKMYLFNDETKKVEFVTDITSLSPGYYRLINYAVVSEEVYARIKATRKSAKNKRNEILVHPDHIYFLFPENIDFSYDASKGGYYVTVNDVTLKDVLKESDIPYYDEVVDELEYYKPIYLYNQKYIELQENDLYGQRYVSPDLESLMFYNKGVWIRDVFHICCLLPAALKMKAVLNYKDHGIKLDVSRNRILEGRKRIEGSITEIMLQHMLSKGVDVELKTMIDSMLEHLHNSLKSH